METKVPKPKKITGCKMIQSEHSGKGKVSFKKAKYIKNYMLMETTAADTKDEKNYYPANPISFDNSKGGLVTPKQKGIITWWRVYGHNASGDGIWSEPFGGFPIY